MGRSPRRRFRLAAVLATATLFALAATGTAAAGTAAAATNAGRPAAANAIAAGARPAAAADPSDACTLVPGSNTCQSSDPQVTVDLLNSGDTSGCTFDITLDWGDGSDDQSLTIAGGPDGPEFLASHTYKESGTYTIDETGDVASGSCYYNPATFQFTLGCTTGYQQPTDWNTAPVDTITPGVEPLNVIISGCSSVSLSRIYQAMSGDWTAGCSGLLKISNELADVTGDGYVDMAQAWRQGGSCAIGDYLSLFGLEDHVRMWNQPMPGTTAGSAGTAEFFTASFETACVQLHGKLKPFREKDGTFRTGKPWHCIDGGPGSYFTDGYDDGARTFANAIITAAQAQGWTTQLQVETRPVNPGSIDENGVGASGQVYVVTVNDNAPQD